MSSGLWLSSRNTVVLRSARVCSKLRQPPVHVLSSRPFEPRSVLEIRPIDIYPRLSYTRYMSTDSRPTNDQSAPSSEACPSSIAKDNEYTEMQRKAIEIIPEQIRVIANTMEIRVQLPIEFVWKFFQWTVPWILLPGQRGNQTRTMMRNWKVVWENYSSIYHDLTEIDKLLGGAIMKYIADPTSKIEIKIPLDEMPISIAKRLYKVCEDVEDVVEQVDSQLREMKKALGVS